MRTSAALLASGLLAAICLAAGAAGAPARALAASAAPTDGQCFQQGIGGPTNTDLAAVENSGAQYDAPADATSVSSTSSVPGYFEWYFDLANRSSSDIASPAITINSGLDPGVFDGGLPSAGFPSSCGQSLLPADQSLALILQAPGTQISFEPGFDSTRTVSPATVPVGGGDVTITDTVTVTDDTDAGGPLTVNLPDIGAGQGVTLVSQTDPTDLTNGETVYHCIPGNCTLPNGVPPTTYALENLHVGTAYTFVTVVNVANPPAGAQAPEPWSWSPTVIVGVASQATCISESCGGGTTTGSSQTIAVPSLDGSTPGSGSVTFSVGTSSDSWTLGLQPSTTVFYPESPYPPPSPGGTSDATFGKPTSATTSLDRSTHLGDPTRGVTARLTVPANALPGDDRANVTTVSLYPVKNPRALERALPRGYHYVAAAAASWITANGSVPKALKRVTMSISDAHIKPGEVIYQVTSAKRLKRIGTVKTRRTVRIEFTSDPTFVIARR